MRLLEQRQQNQTKRRSPNYLRDKGRTKNCASVEKSNLISIVDDRLYHGSHPDADPFSLARVPSKLPPIKDGKYQRTPTHMNISKSGQLFPRTPSTTCESPDSATSIEDTGVYSQRDIIIRMSPLYSFAEGDGMAKDEQFLPLPEKLVVENEEINDVFSKPIRDPCSPAHSFPRSCDDSTNEIRASPSPHQLTCWMDMFTTLCTATVYTRGKGKRNPYLHSCTEMQSKCINRFNGRHLRTHEKTESFEMPLVQSHPRRHKVQEIRAFQQQEPFREQPPQLDRSKLSTLPWTTPDGKSIRPTSSRSSKMFAENSSLDISASVAIYPIARYSAKLNSQELVERRRQSLRKYLTFEAVVQPEESAFLQSNRADSKSRVEFDTDDERETAIQ